MTLKDWMKRRNMTEHRAADLFGVSQTAIHRYCNGRVPRPEIILRIKRLTHNYVTERDWYSDGFLGPDVLEQAKLASEAVE